MHLQEFLARLSYGPLSNLALGSDGSGVIAPAQVTRLTRLTEQGLLALYGRFVLQSKELLIRASRSRTSYPLIRAHALSDPTIGIDKFIIDTPAVPFQGDVLRVLQVFDEYGCERALNDTGNETGVFTPAPDILQLPLDPGGTRAVDGYSVLYQARHPALTGENPPLLVPDSLLSALEANVAYHVFTAMNGQEHSAKGAEWLSRYEMLCAEVEGRDLVSSSVTTTHSKLHDRGFV